MQKSFYMLLFLLLTLIIQSAAFAECNCKQPAYKAEIDFLTSYTGCLDECFNMYSLIFCPGLGRFFGDLIGSVQARQHFIIAALKR